MNNLKTSNPKITIGMKTWNKEIPSLLLILTCSFSIIYAQSDSVGVKVKNRVPAIGSYVPDGMARGYWGNIGLGGTAQSRTRLSGDFINPDGNIMAAIGLGNPEKVLGLDVRVNIYGLFNQYGSPENLGEGSVDAHLSRMLNPRWWLAMGAHDIAGWNLAPAHKVRSIYLSMTGIFYFVGKGEYEMPFNKLYLTAGFGNGRFRTDKNYSINDEAPMSFFASAALQVLPEANAFLEWNGFDMMAGFSVFPIKKFPAQLLLGVDDIFNEKWRFVVAASVGVSLAKGKPGSFRRLTIMPPPSPQTSRVN